MLRSLFNKDLNLIWLAQLGLLVCYTIHGTLLPLYIQQAGHGEGENGLILGMASLGALVSLLLMGRIIDRSSCRKYIAAGAAIWVFTSGLLLLTPFTWLLVVSRFLQGFGYALFYTASLIYATRSVPDEWRGTIIGMVEAIGALAIALTPFLAIWIMNQKGFKAAFITAGLVALLTLLSTIFLSNRPPLTPVNAHRTPFRLISRQALLPGLVASSLFFVAIAFVSLSPLIAQHLGIANISLYLALRAICTVPTRLFSGFISDRKGFSWAIVPGFVIAGVSMLLLPFLTTPGWVMLVPILFGLGMGTASPALTNWMLRRVDAAQHAVAVNTFTLLTESAGFLGTWLVGLFLQTGNLNWLLFLGLVLIIGLAIYLFAAMGGKIVKVARYKMS